MVVGADGVVLAADDVTDLPALRDKGGGHAADVVGLPAGKVHGDHVVQAVILGAVDMDELDIGEVGGHLAYGLGHAGEGGDHHVAAVLGEIAQALLVLLGLEGLIGGGLDAEVLHRALHGVVHVVRRAAVAQALSENQRNLQRAAVGVGALGGGAAGGSVRPAAGQETERQRQCQRKSSEFLSSAFHLFLPLSYVGLYFGCARDRVLRRACCPRRR